MASDGPITLWQMEREKVEAVTDFIFLGSKITVGGDLFSRSVVSDSLTPHELQHSRQILYHWDTHTHFCCSVAQSCPMLCDPMDSAHQASLSFTISWSLLKLMSLESVMPSNHLILCHPFSCLQSFPASGSFLMSQFFESGGQSIGVAASAQVLPVIIQD